MPNKNQVEEKISILDLIYANPFFSELTPEQMQIVARYWRVKKYPKGTTIFKENDEPDFLYYVLEGKLEVLKTIKNDTTKTQEVKVAELHKDHLLGELAIIESTKRSATVVTKSPTLLLMIQAKHFHLLVKSRPEIGVILMKQVAKLISSQLRDTTGRYANTQLVG